MISDKAYIDPKAQIGKNVTVYPFAYIEGDVVIGDDCVIYPYASIMNGTRLGKANKVYQNTVLGAEPQDFRFEGEETTLVVGEGNIFRENVVINRATHSDGVTSIGDRNFFMEGVHVSHDTKIGRYCTIGYGSKIAGDCLISDGAILSSSVIVNAGVRVGAGAMLTAGTNVNRDVPPFIVATATPVKYGGLNEGLLISSGVDERTVAHIANAYRLIFHGQTSVFDACIQVKQQVPDGKEIRMITEFLDTTKLGIISKL